MPGFWTSFSGKLVTFSTGIALMGGGASPLVGGTMGVAMLGAGFLFGIALTIVAVAMALEDHPEHVTGLLIGLPFALFLFAFGQLNMAKSDPGMGYLLIVLGALAVARGLFGASAENTAKSPRLAPH